MLSGRPILLRVDRCILHPVVAAVVALYKEAHESSAYWTGYAYARADTLVMVQTMPTAATIFVAEPQGTEYGSENPLELRVAITTKLTEP